VVKVERKVKKEEKPLVCHNCVGHGHTSRQCPSDSFFCGTKRLGNYGGRRPMVKCPFYCKGFVKGHFVDEVVLDTGCSRRW